MFILDYHSAPFYSNLPSVKDFVGTSLKEVLSLFNISKSFSFEFYMAIHVLK
jgi:hypothetical protein